MFRPPTMLDFQFIFECYEDWPVTEALGPVLESDVKDWIRFWMNRDAETCLVWEDVVPIGLLTYRKNMFVAVVDNIVVLPSERGIGHSTRMMSALKDKLVAEGVVVAEFEAIPGRIADKTIRGDFQRIGEGIGRRSGLPVVVGRVTDDMDV